jgi:hypothetical protein
VSVTVLPGTLRGSSRCSSPGVWGAEADAGGGFTVYAHGGGTGLCARATAITAAATMATDTSRLMRP